MSFEHEKRTARRLLSGIEDASLTTHDLRSMIEDADPALVYLIVGWLRARYRPGHSASEGVLGRLVELAGHRAVAAKVEAGKRDAIASWFEDTHDYGDLDRDAFIDLVVDKLEG